MHSPRQNDALLLQKIREERDALLLIVPKWPNQLWFLELVNLLSLKMLSFKTALLLVLACGK